MRVSGTATNLMRSKTEQELHVARVSVSRRRAWGVRDSIRVLTRRMNHCRIGCAVEEIRSNLKIPRNV